MQSTAERRVVTALFCDVVNSTSLAETMDPEEWADIVHDTVAAMAGCVERYEGTIAQFAGDSILGIFGAPRAHEDDPYRAVRAGLDIIERVGRSPSLPVQIEVRAGAHTGLVIVGDLSAGDLSTYSALGDTTNVAARMQSLAVPGSLLISADTYALVDGDVTAENLGPMEIKGKSEPITVYKVTDAREANMRRRGVPGFESPMVGRDLELSTLAELVGYAAAGSGRVATIVGEPGVGKSRLVAELRERVDGIDGSAWVVGRSAPYDQQRPYHLAASIVRSLSGVTASDEPDVVSMAVRSTAEGVFGPDAPPIRHLLQLIGIEAGHPDDDPAVLHAYYDVALTGLIAGIADRHAPLVLVCEDIHWSDASSAALLSGMLDRIRQSRTVLVLVSRPDRQSSGWDVVARAQRELGEAFVETHLSPLDERNSRTLIANLVEIESLPDGLRTLALRTAEGNPFFIEELVRMLVERDLIREVDGRWVADEGITSLSVPNTLHGLLASRFDVLPDQARATAKTAAVIGRRFETRLLRRVLQGDNAADGLPSDLNTLETHGLVKLTAAKPDLTFSFRHALTHDVVYESILRKERRELHRRVADAIVDLHSGQLADYAPTLARHYEEAGDEDQALTYLVMAGEAARARHALPESHDFYARAYEIVEADPTVPPSVRIDLALSAAAAGMNFIPGGQTLDRLEAVRTDAEALGDTEQLARAYSLELRVRTMLEENYSNPAYRELMDRAFALAPTVRTPEVRAYLEGMMGQALRSADEYRASVQLVGGSVDPLEAAGRFGEAGLNAAYAADVEASRGRFAEADEWIGRAAHLADVSGNPGVIADVDLVRGRIAAGRGELQEALAHTQRGITTAADASNIQCELVGNFLVADQHLRSGDPASAISHLERTFELGAFCNAEAMVELGQAWLASARAGLGDLDPDGFSRPLEMARRGGSRSGEAAVRMQRAIAVAGGPDPQWDLAFDDFERAIVLLGDIGARPDQARAIHAYANALEAAGRDDESKTQFASAMSMFDAMGIQPDAVSA